MNCVIVKKSILVNEQLVSGLLGNFELKTHLGKLLLIGYILF